MSRQPTPNKRIACHHAHVHISAKSDYAMRAMLVLANAPVGSWVKTEVVAEEQHLPRKFLEAILSDLRRARLVESLRGAEGGYRLARPPAKIFVADVMRAVDGPLAEVRGLRPETLHYEGAAAPLQDVWVAVRAGLRAVLERITLADVAAAELPAGVQAMIRDEEAWTPRI
ncbi:MAG TPA: Rrf2 family transcriptional regulator [Acidothermaceae bacterium]